MIARRTLTSALKVTLRFLVTSFLFLVGCGVVYRIADPLGEFARRRTIESKLKLGLTEADVIRALGAEPDLRYTKNDAPSDYYVVGWERRERPITGSVLIFAFGEPICYAWFDEHGHLEDSFVGGS
jgi:hypothetical protein